MNTSVVYYSHEGFGQINLDRPKNNALDLDTLTDLAKAFTLSSENGDACCIFTAQGPNFTVGADLKYIHKLLRRDDKLGFDLFGDAFQNITQAMLAHSGVIIVGLHGWVIGGGFEISLAADLRFASDDTKIKLPELSIATMFSNASTKLLSQIVGLGRAKELMFLGHEINAQQALDIGLINRVCKRDDLDTELKQTAKKITENLDKLAIKLAKELILRNQDLPIDQVLRNESVILSQLGRYEAFRSRINKFVSK